MLFMMEYLKPTILECGTSESIIKGKCGWGSEGVLFDKTGTTKHRANVWYSQTCPGGGGVVNICKVCRNLEVCSTQGNECSNPY